MSSTSRSSHLPTHDPGAAAERRPYHRLFALYLLVSAPALLFPYRPGSWPLLLAAHLLGAAFLWGWGPTSDLLARLSARSPRLTTFVADWYLLLLIPALYTELATLNFAVWNGHYFDDLILGWESLLFGQPSQDLALRFNILALSEILHAAYIAYYLIIYVPPIILYASGRRSAHRTVVFGIMLTFFVHYLFFIYFPVQGPRYLFPAPGGEIAAGPVYALTHQLLEAGSSQGAAFPSSHVGVATAATMLAFTYLPRLAPLLAVMTVALAVGAVYGGFHYATDASAGMLLGLVIIMSSTRVRRILSR